MTRQFRLNICTLTVGLAISGCADHRVPAASGDAALPRVGWVIMHGHKDNPNEEFGCQSNPRSDCAVRASGPAALALSEVYLYFHPTRTDTKYSGTVHIGFFADGEKSPGLKPLLTVKPGDVGNHSVVGIVTDKPGRYTMSIDINAVTQSGAERRIREEVPVLVQANTND